MILRALVCVLLKKLPKSVSLPRYINLRLATLASRNMEQMQYFLLHLIITRVNANVDAFSDLERTDHPPDFSGHYSTTLRDKGNH
jgi:hypothetical protein